MASSRHRWASGLRAPWVGFSTLMESLGLPLKSPRSTHCLKAQVRVSLLPWKCLLLSPVVCLVFFLTAWCRVCCSGPDIDWLHFPFTLTASQCVACTMNALCSGTMSPTCHQRFLFCRLSIFLYSSFHSKKEEVFTSGSWHPWE